ncbi:hypothetical protein EDB85DRAFT_2230980 [Lactarius pseudohatsudake]|nr:hypothetical protein EDB85DRAFT_2230980 [Lactarius pseudohatsudake]
MAIALYFDTTAAAATMGTPAPGHVFRQPRQRRGATADPPELGLTTATKTATMKATDPAPSRRPSAFGQNRWRSLLDRKGKTLGHVRRQQRQRRRARYLCTRAIAGPLLTYAPPSYLHPTTTTTATATPCAPPTTTTTVRDPYHDDDSDNTLIPVWCTIPLSRRGPRSRKTDGRRRRRDDDDCGGNRNGTTMRLRVAYTADRDDASQELQN